MVGRSPSAQEAVNAYTVVWSSRSGSPFSLSHVDSRHGLQVLGGVVVNPLPALASEPAMKRTTRLALSRPPCP